MPEPISIAALIIGAVGALATEVAGSRADAALSAFGGAIKDRITGRDGTLPRNHDVERAVRFAHIQALAFLAAEYEDAAPAEAARKDYANRLRAWLREQAPVVSIKEGVATFGDLDIDWPSAPDLVGAIDAALSGADSNGLLARAEAAAWKELELFTRPAPDSFQDHFFGREGWGWRAAFATCLGAAIKENERFRAIFVTKKLVALSESVDRFARFADLTVTQLNQTTCALAALQDQTETIQREVSGVRQDVREALELMRAVARSSAAMMERQQAVVLRRKPEKSEIKAVAEGLNSLSRGQSVVLSGFRYYAMLVREEGSSLRTERAWADAIADLRNVADCVEATHRILTASQKLRAVMSDREWRELASAFDARRSLLKQLADLPTPRSDAEIALLLTTVADYQALTDRAYALQKTLARL